MASCDSTAGPVSALSVTFSQGVQNPEGDDVGHDVTNPSNYRLVGAGEDGSLETNDCEQAPAGDDVEIPISTVTYGSDSFAADLDLLVEAPSDRYALFVCDEIVGESTFSLDGDGDGVSGGDFVIDFRIDNGNLLDNGHLDCDLRDWIVWSEDPDEVIWHPIGAGVPFESGSVWLRHWFAPEWRQDLWLSQCVEGLRPGLTHRLGGRYRTLRHLGALLLRACTFYDAPECMGVELATLGGTEILLDTTGYFLNFESELVVPSGAISAQCLFGAQDMLGGEDLILDTLRLDADWVFLDGFESGNSSMWSSESQ